MVRSAFKRQDLKLIKTSGALSTYIEDQNARPLVLLLMSSGNYGGLDLKRVFG